MLSKRYKSTEVDHRTWLLVPSGTPWSISSDTHQLSRTIKKRGKCTQHNTCAINIIKIKPYWHTRPDLTREKSTLVTKPTDPARTGRQVRPTSDNKYPKTG